MTPGSLLLTLVLLAWVLLLRGALKWAKRVLGLAAAAMLVIAFIPLGEWVLYPLESRFAANPVLPQRVDGIIVLGGAEDGIRTAAWEQVETNAAADRFLASIALARRYPAARVLFTSGSTNLTGQTYAGAEVAKKLYAQHGLDASRLLFERVSRNTAENVALGKALAKPAPGEVWLLVTSAFHMPRAAGIFCKAGWPVVPYPVDHLTVRGDLVRFDFGFVDNLDALSVGMKEWLGLAAYYATGRTGALFPAGCTP